MEISLHKDSIVDERTGEVSAPSEYVENLRGLERLIERCDTDIAVLAADLSTARKAREKAVQALRTAVREGKVLPLLEVAEERDSSAGDNGDDF